MEKKGDTFTSLSPTTRFKNKLKIQKKEEEYLHYTTLKDKKPSLILNLPLFRASVEVFISKRGF